MNKNEETLNLNTFSDEDVMRQTAALWKYKAVPPKNRIPEPAPEYRQESHTIDDWRVIAARVRGKKHKHDGSNCDDWFETENINGIFVSAVSDGAGSKIFSRIGSKTSCEAAILFLKKHISELLSNKTNLINDLARSMKDPIFSDRASLLANIVQRAMQAAREAVIAAYESRRREPHYTAVVGRDLVLNDFAATLLLTVVVPIPKINEMLVVACQVGDGIIAALNTEESYDKAVTLLGVPDSGAFSGETDFLTSSNMAFINNLMGRTKLARKPLDLILSMTDGVADDYDPNEREIRRLYFDLIANHVLPINFSRKSDVAKNLETIKIPDPQLFPKVDGSVEPKLIPVQYTTDLMQMNNLTLSDIWENREPLIAMSKKIAFKDSQNAAIRLLDWLDNYTMRGSFDDRTLVIFRKEGNARV